MNYASIAALKHFKYLRIMITLDGGADWDVNSLIGQTSNVIQVMYKIWIINEMFMVRTKILNFN